MRKIFILPIAVFTLLFMSCAAETDEVLTSSEYEIVTPDYYVVEIPKDKLIHRLTINNCYDYTIEELMDMCKKDIEVTEPEYEDALKNNWTALIASRLSLRATDTERWAFITEQIKSEEVLPNYHSFFYVLYKCKSFKDEAVISALADDFIEKQVYIIEKKYAADERLMKKKRGELVYAARTFGILMNTTEASR